MATGRTYSTNMIRWGPVVAGAVVGFAVLILLSTLWLALAEGAGIEAIGDNLHWFGLVSAIIALLVAGFLAGWLSGVRGAVIGLLHGVTVWGLILVATLAFAIPQTLQVFQAVTTPLPDLGAGPAWASFWSVLIGLVAAGSGGLIGGALTRPIDDVRTTDARHAGDARRADDRGYDSDTRRADDRSYTTDTRRADDRSYATDTRRADDRGLATDARRAGDREHDGDTRRADDRGYARDARRDPS